jgi:hypothetical protein
MASATYGGGSFHGAPAGAPGNAAFLLPILGVLVDWYPAPQGALHAGGSFGFGGVLVEDSSNRDYRAFSPAGSLFGGLSSWLGPQASLDLSAMFSLSGSASAKDQHGQSTGYDFMSLSGGLEFTLVIH